MSDVEISRTESLTRHQAAKRLAALAAALGDDGHVEVALGASTVKLQVPDHVRCEVEVDGDEVEFEVELKWSTAASAPASAHASAATEPAAAWGAKAHSRARA